MTLTDFQGKCSFLHVLSFLLTRAVQVDSKKHTRHTVRILLKHAATDVRRSGGMSSTTTNEMSLVWYFLTLLGLTSGEAWGDGLLASVGGLSAMGGEGLGGGERNKGRAAELGVAGPLPTVAEEGDVLILLGDRVEEAAPKCVKILEAHLKFTVAHRTHPLKR